MMSGGSAEGVAHCVAAPPFLPDSTAPTPGRCVIDQQLDELLSSLEKEELQRKTQAASAVQTASVKHLKRKRPNRTKLKRPHLDTVGGYTSDGNSDVHSCDTDSLSPVGVQVLSPTALCEGADVGSGRAGWPEHPLPPCRICGDRASGFHYGANTCEACKGFFRRSLKRKKQYRQSCGGNCPIGSSTRSGCAFCRYQKCIACGMSKTAIKTGRYTHEKKARDIEEVKKIKIDVLGDEAAVEDNRSDDEKRMELFIKKVVAAHDKLNCLLRVNKDERDRKINEYVEKKNMQEKVFGYMAPLSMDQYKDFYNATGIDIDGRREMITTMFQRADHSIKRYIDFCKGLPGFDELVMEDQIALIKAGRWDYRLLAMYRWMDTDARIFMSGDMNTVVHRDDFVRMGRAWADIVDTMFTVAARMQKLHLHDIEVAFLKVIAIFSKDRANLKEPAAVEALQNRCVDALLYHWDKNRPDRRHLLGNIFMILTDLRSVSHKQSLAEESMTFDLKDKFSLDLGDIPPLILEMMSS